MANTDEAEDKQIPTGADEIKQAVENANAVDDSLNEDEVIEDDDDAAEGEDQGEDKDSAKKSDDEDSDSDGDKEDDSNKEDQPARRFTQFAGDGKPESYITNLEKAYEESSAEGIRLNQELRSAVSRVDNIIRAAETDPDLADKLNKVLGGSSSGASNDKPAASGGVDTLKDPFLVDAQTKWQQQSEKEAQDFIDSNPEVLSDPKLKSEVIELMETFSSHHYKATGTLMTAGEAMRKAYAYLGKEDKSQKAKEAMNVKQAASPARAQGSRKPAKTGADLTESQRKFGNLLGVSEETLKKYANK